MNDTRNNLAKLIAGIRENYSLIDKMRPSAFESLVAEVVAQNKKLLEVQRNAFHGLDYVAKVRDELDRVQSFAVEVKKLSQPIGVDIVRKFHESILSQKLDRGYLVANSSFTEAARRAAEEYNQTLELVDHSSLRHMIEQYETNQALFVEGLYQNLHSLELHDVVDIQDPTAEQIEQIQPEDIGLSEPQKSALITVDSIPFRLVARILRAPHEIRNLTPRQFEEFVAETLAQLGFRDVILTPRSHDGGKDVIASHHINGIPLSFYFECKRYSEGNKVQLETLRALLGTLAHDARNVNKGVLVTTSTFTKGAKEFILSECRLDGKDYEGILGWIDELKKKI